MSFNLLPWRDWNRHQMYKEMLVCFLLPLFPVGMSTAIFYRHESLLLQKAFEEKKRISVQIKELKTECRRYREFQKKQADLQALEYRQADLLKLFADMGALLPDAVEIKSWQYHNQMMTWKGQALNAAFIADWSKKLSAVPFLSSVQIKQIQVAKGIFSQTFSVQARYVDRTH